MPPIYLLKKFMHLCNSTLPHCSLPGLHLVTPHTYKRLSPTLPRRVTIVLMLVQLPPYLIPQRVTSPCPTSTTNTAPPYRHGHVCPHLLLTLHLLLPRPLTPPLGLPTTLHPRSSHTLTTTSPTSLLVALLTLLPLSTPGCAPCHPSPSQSTIITCGILPLVPGPKSQQSFKFAQKHFILLPPLTLPAHTPRPLAHPLLQHALCAPTSPLLLHPSTPLAIGLAAAPTRSLNHLTSLVIIALSVLSRPPYPARLPMLGLPSWTPLVPPTFPLASPVPAFLHGSCLISQLTPSTYFAQTFLLSMASLSSTTPPFRLFSTFTIPLPSQTSKPLASCT